MNGLLSMLLKASLTASVMIGVLFMLRPLIAGKTHPAVMGLLWMLVLVRLCLPVTLESPVTLADWLPQESREILPAETAQPTDASSGAATRIPQESQPAGWEPDTTQWQADEIPAALDSAPAAASFIDQMRGWLKDISLTSLLTAVWAAGFCLILGSFAVRSVRFRYRLRQCAPVTCGQIPALMEWFRKELGIRRRISVLQCDFMKTPAVFGYFRPCILLPDAFIEGILQGKYQGILIHELCHIRRHDILGGYTWLVAKAIHWFNPLVWLAYRRMQDDTEVCCDHQVVRILGEGEALGYSQSLIDASRIACGSPAPVAAASLFGRKSWLEGRILRIIKPRRRSKWAATLSAVTACLLLITCFTTACQPTPEAPIVESKDDDGLERALEQSAADTPAPTDTFLVFDAPGRYTDEFISDTGKLTVHADAPVTVPSTNALPVVAVSPRSITQAEVDALAAFFFGDRPLIGERSKEKGQTRQELQDAIIKLRGRAADEEDPDEKKRLLDAAAQIEEEIKTAPETIDTTEGTTELVLRDGGAVAASFQCDLGNENNARIKVVNRPDNRSYAEFTNGVFRLYQGDYSPFDSPIGMPGIDPDQARALADAAVNALYPEGLILSNIAVSWHDGRSMEDDDEGLADIAAAPKAYVFEYMRPINGVPSTYTWTECASLLSMEDDVTNPLSYERVEVIVDENGIAKLRWNSPMDVGETLTQNAPLLPFDQVLEIFRKSIKVRYAYIDEPNEHYTVNACDVYVTRVVLGYSRVAVKDRPDEFMMVPVWDFFGYHVNDIPEMDDEARQEVKSEAYAAAHYTAELLTINAIDGSVVDRGFGY